MGQVSDKYEQPAATTTQPPPAAPPQSAQKASQRVEEILVKITPIVETCTVIADYIGPYVNKGFQFAEKLYHSAEEKGAEEYAQIFLGLLLLFFGGNFPVLIAAIEAFRITGWESMKSSFTILYKEYKVLKRKVLLFLSETDPKAVNAGVMGLSSGFMSVLATLRVKFAKTVTLGVSLADCFNETAQKIAGPALMRTLPKEHHKWIDLLISYACRSLAVTIAWWCQRIISALHCAMRGGQMILKGVSRALVRHNIQLPLDLSPSHPAFPAACTALGSIGFTFQAMHGFSLPFPLNILLLPFRILEWALYYMLAYGPQ
ncbi:hypothetical protein DUNSADRAFT_7846 [Dunaliella salina]|uniref:Uncharacterized protein n=1 Tax=Dunaliella salina TaxID=3046 RepID=A0ABQ7GKI2_DUNSA|nr:hypothetical protein DUNSADRAFT_7846 [Dunaliella salina]|eukprot:KAF5835127.1 hypothetical protein DUNSADRAFT_7846 [Dunaliella salina]